MIGILSHILWVMVLIIAILAAATVAAGLITLLSISFGAIIKVVAGKGRHKK